MSQHERSFDRLNCGGGGGIAKKTCTSNGSQSDDMIANSYRAVYEFTQNCRG